MNMQGAWIRQGFFAVAGSGAGPTFTESVAAELSQRLTNKFRSKGYPVGPRWRHTFMWRTGTRDFAEAQFFMRVARDYPVLSLGLYVEKGYENPKGLSQKERKTHMMQRRTWHWPRFLREAPTLLAEQLPACARALGRPISLRISTSSKAPELVGLRETEATFTYIGSQWFWRHQGSTNAADMVKHLKAIDSERALWVNAYMACDLSAEEADDLSVPEVVQRLLAFETIRKRIHR